MHQDTKNGWRLLLIVKNHMEENSNIRIIQSDEAQWKAALSDYQYSLFLAPEWIESVTDERHTALYLDFYNGNTQVAKLSGLICMESRVKGTQLYFYAAPAFRPETVGLFDDCHRALKEWAAQQGYSRIIIGSYDQQALNRCQVKGFFTNLRYEYIVDFKREETVGNFSTGFKKNYKKAQKLGTTFHSVSGKDQIEQLLSLMGITNEIRVNKYGNRYNPFYLKNLDAQSLEKLVGSGVGKIYYTLTDNQVYSMQFNVERDKKSYGLLMGSDNFAYKNGLPSYVDYNLIEIYRDNGFSYYNSGGGPVEAGGEGIEQYKKSMGAEKSVFAGSTTNFLVFPQKILNPLLNLGRKLPATDKGWIGFLKRFI
jgi:hypothetical protein